MVNTELLQLPLHINNYQYEISYLYSINLKKIVVVYSTVQEKKMEKLNWRGLIREKDVDELKEALEEGVAIVFEILAPRHTDQQHTPLVLCPFAVCASAAQHTKQVLELVQYCVNVIRYATQRNAPAAQSPRRLVLEARAQLGERVVVRLHERVGQEVLALRHALPTRGLRFALESRAFTDRHLRKQNNVHESTVN